MVVITLRALAAAVACGAFLLATGCAGASAHSAAGEGTHMSPVQPTADGLSHRAEPKPGPSHTAQRPPRFSASVSGPLSPRDVPFSWRPGCPLPPRDLRAIRLSYFGFDGTAHTGEIIVSASVVRQVIRVFAILYRARFPIRRIEPVDAFHGSDPRSMAADNTSGFNCRRAVAPGPPQWSMHAYGLAIDVNTVQNPYVEAGVGVQPPAGAAYVNRSQIRPGMAYQGGVLVSAFSSIGWGWGGNWSGSPDYQHFSVNGR